ncbi:MFS transporter [Acinetobacter sp.]|uniref:MFS transporter n=1 Tax=Acinetobacter sp. TaxID=472 RepID=UPI003CFC1A64
MLSSIKAIYSNTPPIVKFIILAEAVVLFAFEIVNPYMAIYFKEVINGSEFDFGIYNSIFYFLMLLGSFITLYLPQISSKTYLSFYYFFSFLTMAIRGVASSPSIYGIGKLIQAIPGTIGGIIPGYIILSATDKKDTGKILNIGSTFSGIFLFAAPLLGKIIIDSLGYRWAFALSSLLFICLLIVLNVYKFDSCAFEDRSPHSKVQLKKILRIKNFALFFASFYLRFLPLATFSLYLALFLKTQKGFSLYDIAIYFAVVDFLTILLQIPAGMLVDKYDKRIFIFLDGITDAVFALICLFSNEKLLILFGALISRLFNIPGGTAFSIMMRNLFPKENLKQILSFSAGVRHLSLIIGPALGGYFISSIGYSPIFYLIIAGSLLYSILSLRFKGESFSTMPSASGQQAM